MPQEKPPYRLTFRFSSDRPDAIGEALARLRELTGEHNADSESTATVTIKAWGETPLTAIREVFEVWLHQYKIGLECEVTQKAPGLRPETVIALRAAKKTPMDEALERLRPEPGSGIEAVELSAGGRTVRLEPKTA